jgi:hypothetical protein
MINIAEIVNDPDFAQCFYVVRSTGSFQLGGWVDTPTTIGFYGVIEVATEKELKTLPEGDRITGALSFHTELPIFMTLAEGMPDYGQGGYGKSKSRLSDIVLWRNQQYRIVKIYPWADFGYYKTIGVRMSGA